LDKYVSDGVNNITVFESEDFFAHKNASYATSEAHAITKLRNGDYEICIDVKRCRIGGIYPMPLKVKTGSGYELLADSQFSYDARPEDVFDASKYEYGKTSSKESNWQRRLLDLSLKNNLLNFRYRRDCLHLISADLQEFCQKLEEKGKFNLLPVNTPVKDAVFFGDGKEVRNMAELIRIEMRSVLSRKLAGSCRHAYKKSSLRRRRSGRKNLISRVRFPQMETRRRQRRKIRAFSPPSGNG